MAVEASELTSIGPQKIYPYMKRLDADRELTKQVCIRSLPAQVKKKRGKKGNYYESVCLDDILPSRGTGEQEMNMKVLVDRKIRAESSMKGVQG